mmetsp:Transcript_30440/g.87816  ORF Transcript_30440/g.87816 Transcript_30440/m.87816 type:complete len:394 (+) Transcript_30440:1450-2631(+)
MLVQPKSTTMFEIRIAVIGHVSVGKTTLINALFGAEYGEVAMKRTTAVVNAFRITPASLMTKSSAEKDDESVELVSSGLSAESTLEETKADNSQFRNGDDSNVHERSFDIALDDPIHKMRGDTKLVIVDIPGINEAGTSSKYKDFVNENWHTFDVAILVMDARQGVNTQEQHDLLQLAKDNIENSKLIPLIVLNNKVDDPEDEEQAALLREACEAIESLFQVSCRKESLGTILHSKKKKKIRQPYPVVIPMSAMHAFVYRCGSRLSFADFRKMSSDFIDKIGKDSYGRQWRRYDDETKLKKAYQAVSDEEQRQDGLDVSNFGTLLKVLAFCIGDEERQLLLIERQVVVTKELMEKGGTGIDLGAAILSLIIHTLLLASLQQNFPRFSGRLTSN